MRNIVTTLAVLGSFGLPPVAASGFQATDVRHATAAAIPLVRHPAEAVLLAAEAAQLRVAAVAQQAALLHSRDMRGIGLQLGTLADALAPLAALQASPQHLPHSYAPQDPADELWREGRSRLNQSQFRAAAELFRRIRTEQRFAASAYRPGAYYWEAFALTRFGSTDELRQARELLEQMRQRYPEDRQIRDADALAASISGRLARGGDAGAAQELQTRASASSDQCAGRDDDVRLAALNGLLHMDAANALPILREVLAKRDECSVKLRRQAIFLVSQKRGAGVDQLLLEVVRNDPDTDVRANAVFWLSQVNTPEAIAALEDILRTSTERKVQEQALFALSQNRSDRAGALLRAFASQGDAPLELRRNAIFWIGQRRGEENIQYLRNLYGQLTDAKLKEHVLFAVAQSRDPTSGDWLLDLALRDGEGIQARKQALFFAVQHDAVPMERIIRLYDGARDRELKKQVLFAMSQKMNDAAAVEKLMDIGRNETDAELRKQAVFWLSQSRDPRVAQFLLEIINR